MAVTTTTSPGQRVAVFGNPVIIASTTSVTDEVLRLRVTSGINVLSEQYALVVDGVATFQMQSALASILAGFNNPISYTMAPGAVQVVPTAKHYKDDLTYTLAEPVNEGTQSLSNRKIFKAIRTESETTWIVNIGQTKDCRFAMHGAGEVSRRGFVGMKIPLSIYSGLTASTLIEVNKDVTSPAISVAGNEEFFVTTWKDNLSAKDYTFDIASEPYNRLRVYMDNWCPRGKILYFLNDLGGWEWHTFIDYDVNERTDKEQLTTRTATGQRNILQKITDTTKEYKLYSRTVASENVSYLRYLLTSPVVLDENGLQVRVMDDNFRTDSSELIEPNVTIRYVEEDTINV